MPGWILLAAILACNLVHWMAWQSRLARIAESALLALLVFAGAWFVLAIAGLFVFRLRCPGCGERFFEGNHDRYLLKAPVSILLMNDCRKCGLSIGGWREAPPNKSLERTREG
jgi:hypothetical protein